MYFGLYYSFFINSTGHYDSKIQTAGIVGAIQAIGVLGKKGKNHLINFEDTCNTMTQVGSSTQALMNESTVGTRIES